MKMTLEGLETIGFVVKEETRKEELEKLIAQTGRKLTDSDTYGVSNESRLSFAYTVILLCATIALRLTGYRVKSKQDYHYRTIETLRHTLKCKKADVDYYQILREKRHQDIYGDEFMVSDNEVNQALKESKRIFQTVKDLVNQKYPGLAG
jgi:uncharacterized protein (UPF0332 family)